MQDGSHPRLNLVSYRSLNSVVLYRIEVQIHSQIYIW